MTKAGNQKMCQRELRNMQKVMLKTKIANKPKYLLGASDGDTMLHTIGGGPKNSTLISVGNPPTNRGLTFDEMDAQEAAYRNMVLSDKTKDSLYQAEDSARSKGLEYPAAALEDASTPFTIIRGQDAK
jgi:hypothetical protein